MPMFLVPVEAGHCLIPLEKAIMMIGRQADCDISLTNSRKISRRHCCIAQVNNSFVIRDLGSTNGVFLNGKRVQKEAAIKINDELVIGDVKFKLLSEIPESSNPNLKKIGNIPAKVVENTKVASPAAALRGASRTPGVPPIPKLPPEKFEIADAFELEDDDTEQEPSPDAKSPSDHDGIRIRG